MKTIFITYNPNSAFEQTLAIRLHTIGAANGFRMYLPDRYNSETILDDETKSRINRADYVVMFSTSPLSAIVKQEIEYAFKILKDKSKIVIVYDKHRGKNITGKTTENFTPIYVDQYNDQEDVLRHIITLIQSKELKEKDRQVAKLSKEKENTTALAALLAIGLGLLILGNISKK